MKTIYHGTTKDNFKSIMENGFGGTKVEKVWNCSRNDCTYFYDPALEEFEGDTERAVQQAFESAQVTAAIQGYQGNELVVIEVELEEECMEPDHSCKHMDFVAVEVENGGLNAYGKITGVYTADWDIVMKPFVLSGLTDSGLLNLDLSPIESRLTKEIDRKGVWVPEILEFDWDGQDVDININDLMR